jgi:hypothetical protein
LDQYPPSPRQLINRIGTVATVNTKGKASVKSSDETISSIISATGENDTLFKT